ncbi:unnamed protein product [Arabidopsis lyrata]|uniref:NmrA-like domain-containing protein n=1 Tax=Arabidopsis lyrata subsp. lyrata TaxID=81972 RepID=D7KSM2_ARALL|nr:hypothetical protein ARALYDRAFT_895394 [Arabidopsis lyrata subsp. lyrata]CAH8258231.1 unnamed protein product [Arabidopsis lyrata]
MKGIFVIQQIKMSSEVLVIGGTGYIGKFIVEGSAKSGHQTFALVREASLSDPIKAISQVGGIPYTYVTNNCFDVLMTNLPYTCSVAQCESRLTSPPRDKATIYGDGNTKAILNKEEDIAAYTMRAIDDPRTLNKTLYTNPPKNIVSHNDIVALWESKIGKTLKKTYVSEEQLLKKIPESPHPLDLLLALNHAIFLKGDQTYFTIEPSFGVEASQLYPDIKYTSVDEYLSQFV